MSAGSISARRALACTRGFWVILAVCVLLAACDHLTRDPPPPASQHELAQAPLGARGAHAAGSDDTFARPFKHRRPHKAPEVENEEPDAGVDAGDEPHEPAPEGVSL